MPPEQKLSTEDVFRSGIEASVEIAKKLQTHCTSIEEMIGVLELALENSAQARILMSLITQPAKR